jgi:hypothetical protein
MLTVDELPITPLPKQEPGRHILQELHLSHDDTDATQPIE